MKTNDKVVCVDDNYTGLDHPALLIPDGVPVRDTVYTITGWFATNSLQWMFWRNDKDRVSIAGVRCLCDGEEIGWRADRFRLVSEVGHPPIAVEQPQEAGV